MSRSATATLTALGVGAASELTSASAQALPVRGELAELLPWGGLRRGSTVSVRGSTSLLLTLVAAATAEGCWAAVVGLPGCGVLAAAELGVAVHRLALVPRPGRDQSEVEKTVAALLDGFDLVSVATPVTGATARKLSARARNRKAVLLPFAAPWPGADVELSATPDPWTGLGRGHGVLTSRTATVRATGRGAAARPRQTRLLLNGTTTPPHPTPQPVPPTPASPPSPSSRPSTEPTATPALPAIPVCVSGRVHAFRPAQGFRPTGVFRPTRAFRAARGSRSTRISRVVRDSHTTRVSRGTRPPARPASVPPSWPSCWPGSSPRSRARPRGVRQPAPTLSAASPAALRNSFPQ